jgi:hypothetical protein
MAAVRQTKKPQTFSDPKAMLRFLEEQDAWTGFVFDPTVTPERVREMMLACGVRPEENLFSRDIIHAKYPGEDQ